MVPMAHKNMKTYYTHCDFHFGDNMAHLHFLRAASKAIPDMVFKHRLHGCYIKQCAEMVRDVPAISLVPETTDGPEWKTSRNVWKNAHGYWENHPRRLDYAEFYLDWFSLLAREIGQPPLFKSNDELLFDYPALLHDVCPGRTWDFLVVNSKPCSGQLPAFNCDNYMDPLLEALVAKGYRVLATMPTAVRGVECTMSLGLSLTGIGNASLRSTHHVMVSTGPSWGALNKWNYGMDRPGARIVMLGQERLNLHQRIQQAVDLPGVFQLLRSESLL